MLYFGDYGINHAKMVPIKHLWSIKSSHKPVYFIEFHYFKLIIYSYSKIILSACLFPVVLFHENIVLFDCFKLVHKKSARFVEKFSQIWQIYH
ncbi:hypothetical protein AOB46_00140 [Chryseobacterium indologenes]|uniref:Uncharacterized protein n=1 Tax=Chryseobacterium indologenes TaxID=253 RepID=A0A0N1KSJ1_CHRID|nr:hypothetical protein AOB46_00140 [Chryseobacterium indologenes]